MFINDRERSPWEAVNVRSSTYDSSCFEHEKKYNLKIDYNILLASFTSSKKKRSESLVNVNER